MVVMTSIHDKKIIEKSQLTLRLFIVLKFYFLNFNVFKTL